MEYQKIAFSKNDGVGIVSLDSPKNMNAVDELLIEELVDALNVCENDPDVRAVLLNSTGRAFSGGGDIGYMYQKIKKGDLDFESSFRDVALAMKGMKRLSKPIVGAVNGAAAGAGFILALGCDYVVAAEDAFFLSAFVNVGLVPDTGGLYVMSRALGANKAAELALTGRIVKAEEAKQLGFVAKVVPADELADASMKEARRFASGPAMAYRKTKELLYQCQFADFDEYVPCEVKAQGACVETQDFRDRVIAFVEKKR
ncbi:enoyl-CoA hydratase/isomerase family protein [Arabiibacter massiliensis]|uniref:enoyl-CoA hydratase/isomerase family protein n=1 Tax=Arabiibacter massiliensis TaxID=1870985 RepID=UPI0009BA2A4B|nr:enoyl-CoA hydratase/isomerase family protein [Arabiibacter massiliensis]